MAVCGGSVAEDFCALHGLPLMRMVSRCMSCLLSFKTLGVNASLLQSTDGRSKEFARGVKRLQAPNTSEPPDALEKHI